jgi:hypothetical protein
MKNGRSKKEKMMEVFMKQKRKLLSVLTVFLVLALFTTAFSKDKTIESKWVAKPASVDGLNTEWGSIPMNNEKKVGVEYGFMNDAENLYILFIFKDPKYLSSINWTGLTVWLSPQGTKDDDLGIRFIRKMISPDQYIAILEKQVGQTMPEDKKAQIRKNKAYYLFDQELINKKAEGYDEDAEMPKFKGALFRNNVVEKSIIYEFAISFLELAELGVDVGAWPGKTLSVGFQWGGATKEYKEALASGMAAGDVRAGAGQATGSLTQERGEGSLRDMDPEASQSNLARMRSQLQKVKKYDFWVELKLAQIQNQ